MSKGSARGLVQQHNHLLDKPEVINFIPSKKKKKKKKEQRNNVTVHFLERLVVVKLLCPFSAFPLG